MDKNRAALMVGDEAVGSGSRLLGFAWRPRTAAAAMAKAPLSARRGTMEGLAARCAALNEPDGVLVLSRPKYRELLLDLLDDDAIGQHTPQHPSGQMREPDGHRTRDAAIGCRNRGPRSFLAALRSIENDRCRSATHDEGRAEKLKAIDLIERSCKGQNGRNNDSSTIELPSSQVSVLHLVDLPAEVRAKVLANQCC